MLVYGDAVRKQSCHEYIQELKEQYQAWRRCVPGLERHAKAASLWIEAGCLAQGLLDVQFQEKGCDSWGTLQRLCARLTTQAARLWAQDNPQGQPELWALLEQLKSLVPDSELSFKVPEGYAHYAVYPELYQAAAKQLPPKAQKDPLVIGLRSIGTSLAALVFVALGAKDLPVTVRPVGHPFERRLAIDARLEKYLLQGDKRRHYVLVDEGPGLSGSSFFAASDWLQAKGIDPSQIHFLPSHGGPLGPKAPSERQTRWEKASKRVVSFEELFIEKRPSLLAQWLKEALPGDSGTPCLEDISSGRWREKLIEDPNQWPPVHPFQEKRKYLFEHLGKLYIAKFAGLGIVASRKLDRAQVLAQAGWTAPVLGSSYGFWVSPWIQEGRPLGCGAQVDRKVLIKSLSGYLKLIATRFAAPRERPGASLGQLWQMGRRNTECLAGPELASAWERCRALLGELEARACPVFIDGRLQPWEWLVLPEGRLLKTDALDHAEAHDLIGPQDIAWDVAGAALEYELTEEEKEALGRSLAGRDWLGGAHQRFYELCYAAFQLGYYTLALGACGHESERSRLQKACDRYARGLKIRLVGI